MERSLLDASAGAAAQLDPSVWRAPFRPDVVHGVVKWHLANRRQHGGAVKTVSEISGTGKKVYRQKGTGKVRCVWSLRTERVAFTSKCDRKLGWADYCVRNPSHPLCSVHKSSITWLGETTTC